jgi:hypothetical protein
VDIAVAYDDIGLARIAARGGAIVLNLSDMFALINADGLGQDDPGQDYSLSA